MNLVLNNIYLCSVEKIFPTYVLLKFEDKFGICHISELSDYYVKDISKILAVKKKYRFKLIEIDTKMNKYIFSYKKITAKQLKFNKNITPTPLGFKTLYSDLMDRLEKEEIK